MLPRVFSWEFSDVSEDVTAFVIRAIFMKVEIRIKHDRFSLVTNQVSGIRNYFL
jgi:hypothetical protein